MTEVDELSVASKEPFSGALTRFLGITNSSSSLAFLIGAGCSRCAGLPLTNELTDKVLDDDILDAPKQGNTDRCERKIRRWCWRQY